MPATPPPDRIFIRDLRVEATIGIFDWERRIKQALALDLEMATDIRKAAASDDIKDTLNYKSVAKRLIAFVEASEFQLVETLAERITGIVLSEFDVPWVKLTLNKQGALRGARDVGLIIERSRAARPADQDAQVKEMIEAIQSVNDPFVADGDGSTSPHGHDSAQATTAGNTVYLSLGSNVDARANIKSAVRSLRERWGNVSLSPVYETVAVGFDGDPFINLVAAFETAEPIADLNQRLKQIEAEHGRRRGDERFAPRTLDLDLLLYGERMGDFDGVVLPRDEIGKYAFVLLPLAELAPDLCLPNTKRTLAECWRQFEGERGGMQLIDLEL